LSLPICFIRRALRKFEDISFYLATDVHIALRFHRYEMAAEIIEAVK